MGERRTLRIWGRAVQEALFPQRCHACAGWEEVSSIAGLCADCEALLPWRATGVQPSARGSALRGELWATEYEDPVRSLVFSAKYGGDRSSATTLAGILSVAMDRAGLEGSLDVLVAVPCYWRKRLLRGGDPAAWLCEELGARRRRPRVTGALRRVHDTRALGQFGADLRRRELALADAFRARHHPRLWRARVGLVDDVRTTGATAEGCARALLAAGAGSVTLLAATSAAAPLPASPGVRRSAETTARGERVALSSRSARPSSHPGAASD